MSVTLCNEIALNLFETNKRNFKEAYSNLHESLAKTNVSLPSHGLPSSKTGHQFNTRP